ncbi:MAG: XrtA system polysaccharide deacetylase [Planctomycetota bacterium]|jgi:polysaccharide deacetylase family protein (PEP-CTERM system associated)
MISPRGDMRNAFTVDVEDYFHVQSFADRIDPETWDQYESRVVANTERVLKMLDDRQVFGTFFVLGWVADRFPGLVRRIHDAGHEIGCHSYWHRLIYEMTPEEFRGDVRQAKNVIEQITGEPVTAFRAPSFSITARSLWALEVLIEEGFRYDSSIFPVYHDKYGIPDAERFPHRIETEQGALWEFPPSVHRLWKWNLPVAGGGYFRLYPLGLSMRLLGRINRVEKEPFMFYIHPWELDPEQPRLPGSLRSRFRHYQNLGTTASKLDGLLKRFRMAPLGEVLRESARV